MLADDETTPPLDELLAASYVRCPGSAIDARGMEGVVYIHLCVEDDDAVDRAFALLKKSAPRAKVSAPRDETGSIYRYRMASVDVTKNLVMLIASPLRRIPEGG